MRLNGGSGKIIQFNANGLKSPDNPQGAYQQFMGDRWDCPGCGHSVVVGLARNPLWEHFLGFDHEHYTATPDFIVEER